MNTRIQVEHPISEMISGIDLVKEQIRIAADEPLRLSQSEVQLTGHAIECQINAESTELGFQSCPSRIGQWDEPQGMGIRVNSHCYSGYFISPFYDSLLAKVITLGTDRSQAMERMRSTFENFVVTGIEMTIPFLRIILNHPRLSKGRSIHAGSNIFYSGLL